MNIGFCSFILHTQADLFHLPLAVEDHPFLVMELSLLTHGGKVR